MLLLRTGPPSPAKLGVVSQGSGQTLDGKRVVAEVDGGGVTDREDGDGGK